MAFCIRACTIRARLTDRIVIHFFCKYKYIMDKRQPYLQNKYLQIIRTFGLISRPRKQRLRYHYAIEAANDSLKLWVIIYCRYDYEERNISKTEVKTGKNISFESSHYIRCVNGLSFTKIM